LKICVITPTDQLTGTTPLSKIKLNNLEYIGIIKYTVFYKIYEFGLLSSAQAGFRNAHSTADNIFILHSIINLYLSTKKKLFFTFIDFGRAFDTISLIISNDSTQLSSKYC
jgi:hypothetical protein